MYSWVSQHNGACGRCTNQKLLQWIMDEFQGWRVSVTLLLRLAVVDDDIN